MCFGEGSDNSSPPGKKHMLVCQKSFNFDIGTHDIGIFRDTSPQSYICPKQLQLKIYCKFT